MKTVNLTNLNAEEAAKSLHEVVLECAEKAGQNSSECVLLTPADGEEKGLSVAWRVMWESGPADWGVALSLGNQPFQGFHIEGHSTGKWFMEPYWGFDVGFIES